MSNNKKILYENIIPRNFLKNTKLIPIADEQDLVSMSKMSVILEKAKTNLFFFFIIINIVFLIIVLNLFNLSNKIKEESVSNKIIIKDNKRGKILDKNGKIISATIDTLDLYLDPNKIINLNKTKNKLIELFPNKNEIFFKNLLIKKKYRLVSTHLTKKQEYEIKKLGEPGLVFHKSRKRVYPHNNLFSHVTGFLSRYQKPQSKLEKNYDFLLSKGEDIKLTLDLKVQDIIYQEVKKGMSDYNSKAALGILLNVNKGNILSMVSLPDFNPNHPSKIKAYTENNLITNARYEMGSTLKMFNAALAIENDSISSEDTFDVSKNYELTKEYTVKDDIKMKEPIKFDKVFINSSNIGSIKVLEKVGIEKQKKFFYNLGFNEDLKLKGLSSINNSLPKDSDWNEVISKSISYGYGVSITPLSLVTTFSTLVNGGYKIKPRILNKEQIFKKKILKSQTSKEINILLNQIVEFGTGKKAKVDGISVGGKTATAKKSKTNSKGYDENKIITSFIGIFPAQKPKYILLILFDEPKNQNGLIESHGGDTAAPVFSKIVNKISPILEIKHKRLNYNIELARKRNLQKK